MDTNLLLTLFIGFASLIVAFAICYIAFEMIRDSHATKVAMRQAEAQQSIALAQMQQNAQAQSQQQAQPAQVVVAPQGQPAPTTIVVNTTQPATEATPAPVVIEAAPEVEETVGETRSQEPAPTFEVRDENGNVTFSASQSQTLEEKYALLPVKFQKFYDEIAKYASQIEGHKVIKNSRYEEYKVASARLVRLLIKRGTVIAEFIFSNFDFKNYASENKLAVKQAPTSIKITDEESVKVAKDSIDISYKSYLDEKEMKKELAKEKRKAKREQQK